ncbi:MAG: N-acetylmuramoyl-L-alanine amidase [Candidatus Merdivicinus sp.]|jgi:N-acetylmuramoyl-L-alanine amidase
MRLRKKRNLTQIASIGILLLGILLFFFAAGQLKRENNFHPTAGDQVADGQIIILDPGHGGADGGAVGAVNQIAEKEINLSIALKLRDLLEIQGYTVYMTRESDEMICDPDVSGITNQKKSDMYNRLELMEEYPEAIVLSIHQNKFEQQKYHGAQMFYGQKHPFSQQLAQSIQNAFVEHLQPENEREIKPGEKNLFLLWNAENPIVLVECGFLSNPEECANLCDDTYQSKVAFTIMSGLIRGLSNGDL